MIRAIMLLSKLDKSGGGGGGGATRSNTPEDVAEGVVAGKYRLLFFTPETILNSHKSGYISFKRNVLTD